MLFVAAVDGLGCVIGLGSGAGVADGSAALGALAPLLVVVGAAFRPQAASRSVSSIKASQVDRWVVFMVSLHILCSLRLHRWHMCRRLCVRLIGC